VSILWVVGVFIRVYLRFHFLGGGFVVAPKIINKSIDFKYQKHIIKPMDINRDLGVIFKDKGCIKKTLLGGFFLMFPIVNLLAFGFVARLIHSHLEEGEKKLPSWDHWGALTLLGLEWGLIIAIYSVIPLLFLSLLPKSVFAFLVNPQFVLSGLNLGGHLLLVFSTLFGIIALFFLPMALILFSDSGSFIDALHLEKVFKHIKHRLTPYMIAYILTIFLIAADFSLHILLNKIHFGIVPSYFLFTWLGFTILLISGSLFIESF